MQRNGYAILWIEGEDDRNGWQGVEPGWYWGEIDGTVPDDGLCFVGDTAGPFPNAAETALDMTRTFVSASASMGAPN